MSVLPVRVWLLQPRTLSVKPIPPHTGLACLLFILVQAIAWHSSASEARIGNFFPSTPGGIAFIRDGSAFLVTVIGAGEFMPGPSAADGSYQCMEFKGSPLRLEWTRTGDAAVGRLSTTSAVQANLQLVENTWPGLSGKYSSTASEISGTATSETNPSWHLQFSVPVQPDASGKLTVAVTPERPIYFTAGFDSLPDGNASRIDELLDRASKNYASTRPQASGDWGDFLGAIADNLNNTRLYSSDNNRVAHTVTREWVPKGEPNASPYFCWDSFFNGLLSCLDDPKTGRETIRALLDGAQPAGFVPNFSHWNTGRKVVSSNRSQPPVGALCVWKMHQFQPDPDFLNEVYPKLAAWHRWWFTARDGNNDGLLEWGGDIPLFECGWDDSPHWAGTRKIGNTLNADAVDLNSLYAADAQYLARIADAIGMKKDAEEFRAESARMIKRINDRLWNEELGIYCSRLWDADGKEGAFLTRMTPMNFYPLIAGVPDENRARRVLAHMSDPAKFWGDWILPTVSYDDPLFPQQAYWHGKVWPPVNYLVLRGLKRYGTPEQIAEFGRKSTDLFMRNWIRDRVCGENYLSTTGEQKAQRSDPHYTWGALLCLTGLESLMEINDQGQIIPANGVSQNLQLKNIPAGGKKWDLTFSGGKGSVVESKGRSE